MSVEEDSIREGAPRVGRGYERRMGFGGFETNSERVLKGRRGRRSSAWPVEEEATKTTRSFSTEICEIPSTPDYV